MRRFETLDSGMLGATRAFVQKREHHVYTCRQKKSPERYIYSRFQSVHTNRL